MKDLQPNETKPQNYWYVVGLLTLVYTISFLDRQIISILANDIKTDLGLTDSQLGVLTGLAFALFYATLGIPIGLAADKHNRVKIVSACIAIWSAMTALCGMANNYFQLLVARMGVGIGEAGALPCSHSIITDIVPKEKHSFALGIFQAGVPLGILVGFLIGGWLNEFLGWKLALIIVGLPGILVSAIVYLTVEEPKRLMPKKVEKEDTSAIESVSKILHLLKNTNYLLLTIGITAASMAGYCIIAWMPAHFIRSFGLKTGVLGTYLSILIGFGGAIGSILIGKFSEAFNENALKFVSILLLLCVPSFYLGLKAENFHIALILMVPAYLIFLGWMGPVWSNVHSCVSPSSKSTASAFALLITNLVGLGTGPWLIGKMSDFFNEQGSNSPLAMALSVSLILYPIAALCFVFAGIGQSVKENQNAND